MLVPRERLLTVLRARLQKDLEARASAAEALEQELADAIATMTPAQRSGLLRIIRLEQDPDHAQWHWLTRARSGAVAVGPEDSSLEKLIAFLELSEEPQVEIDLGGEAMKFVRLDLIEASKIQLPTPAGS